MAVQRIVFGTVGGPVEQDKQRGLCDWILYWKLTMPMNVLSLFQGGRGGGG